MDNAGPRTSSEDGDSEFGHEMLMAGLSPRKYADYQRMLMTCEELTGDSLENKIVAATGLMKALELRAFYMDKLGGRLSSTLRKFLHGLPTHQDTDMLGQVFRLRDLIQHLSRQVEQKQECLAKSIPDDNEARVCNEMLENLNRMAASTDDLSELATRMLRTPTKSTPSPTSKSPDSRVPVVDAGCSDNSKMTFSLGRLNGVVKIENQDGQVPNAFLTYYIDRKNFLEDLKTLMNIVEPGPV
ncbi:hypothetical protein AAVH_07773 [Aphelenchoides avenae]|nr:hypothetical protein AAVH_07773 [Aphelenchus avenae]